MTSYNVTIELDQAFGAKSAERAVEALVGFHPAVGGTCRGSTEIVVTVQAERVHAATSAALGLVQMHDLGEPVAVRTQTTADFDRKLGLTPAPELLSVTEVAAVLGITRSAVLQRIDNGSLAAQKVGSTYAVHRGAIG